MQYGPASDVVTSTTRTPPRGRNVHAAIALHQPMFDQLVDLVSGAWWAYLLLFALAFLDAVIPLFPSETMVITAGVLASAGDMQLAL